MLSIHSAMAQAEKILKISGPNLNRKRLNKITCNDLDKLTELCELKKAQEIRSEGADGWINWDLLEDNTVDTLIKDEDWIGLGYRINQLIDIAAKKEIDGWSVEECREFLEYE